MISKAMYVARLNAATFISEFARITAVRYLPIHSPLRCLWLTLSG